MENNKLIEKMRSGKKVLGTFFNIAATPAIETLSQAGLDFILLDTEHGFYDVEKCSQFVMACEARGITPIIRVKDHQRNSILKMLDIGGMGLIIPFIKSVDQVKELVSYGKYRPIGDRGYGMTRKNCFGYDPLAKIPTDYHEWANRETLIMPQCETVEALECIEEIAALTGVDGIFVGPYDLSISMGMPAQFDDPAFIAALKRVLKACKDNNKFAWILGMTPEDSIKKLDMGYDGVASIDTTFLYNGTRAYVDGIRKVYGDYMATFDPEELRAFTKDLFIKRGFKAEDAATISNCLIDANLIGRDSHGLLRIKCYMDRLAHGGMKIDGEFEILKETPTSALVDAHSAMGMVTAKKASELTRKKTLENGMAFVTVKNGDHYGPAAYWAEMIGQDDCIAFSCTNTEPLMAPPGGKKVALGTDPICVYVPSASYGPICLDIATSTVAQGKLFAYKLKHEALGEGWAVDINGVPTKDPDKAEFLTPFGAHKGYGIAVMVEILCAVLSGGGIGFEINSLLKDPEKPNNISFCFMGMKIENFRPLDEFKKDVDKLVEYLHSTPAAEGRTVLVPGEIEISTKKKNIKNGITLPDDLVAQLTDIARTYGVDFPICAKYTKNNR